MHDKQALVIINFNNPSVKQVPAKAAIRALAGQYHRVYRETVPRQSPDIQGVIWAHLVVVGLGQAFPDTGLIGQQRRFLGNRFMRQQQACSAAVKFQVQRVAVIQAHFYFDVIVLGQDERNGVVAGRSLFGVPGYRGFTFQAGVATVPAVEQNDKIKMLSGLEFDAQGVCVRAKPNPFGARAFRNDMHIGPGFRRQAPRDPVTVRSFDDGSVGGAGVDERPFALAAGYLINEQK